MQEYEFMNHLFKIPTWQPPRKSDIESRQLLPGESSRSRDKKSVNDTLGRVNGGVHVCYVTSFSRFSLLAAVQYRDTLERQRVVLLSLGTSPQVAKNNNNNRMNCGIDSARLTAGRSECLVSGK